MLGDERALWEVETKAFQEVSRGERVKPMAMGTEQSLEALGEMKIQEPGDPYRTAIRVLFITTPFVFWLPSLSSAS